MNAATLLPATGGLTAETAAKWVRACLAEAEALKTLDKDLLRYDADPEADARSRLLRAEWGRYAEQASAVYEQAKDVAGVDCEELLWLRTYAFQGRHLAKQSIDVLRDRWHRAEAGVDVLTAEEVRRELALSRHG